MTNMLLDKQWACIRKCPKALIVVVKAPLHSLIVVVKAPLHSLIVVVKAPLHSLCLERLVTSFAALLLLL